MIELLHVDASLIAVNKPAGQLAVPGRQEPDCLARRVAEHFADTLVVHRLDQATSGLMLFARGATMQRLLSRAFAEREVDKRYVAVVNGLIDGSEGTIDRAIAVDWPNRPRRVIDAQTGQPSLTRWQVLERNTTTNTTRVALHPHTGRTHQLRVHLAAIGHPILGDALYAPPEVQALADRLLLHARALGFVHPATGAAMQIESHAPF